MLARVALMAAVSFAAGLCVGRPWPLDAQPIPACAPPVEGIASFYGWHEHGRRMANGRPFHALGATAASKELPLGQLIRVTNLTNGRSERLTVTDRGPYRANRILDVSLGAARVLGMTNSGLARVRIVPLCARG